MNIAIIFAGGTGQRMSIATIPKQFLTLRDKPILVYTLEQFQQHPEIDGIVIVMLKDWIGHTEELIEKYNLNKVKAVIPGGETGFLSRYNGVMKASELFPADSVALIHDGVRPLIDAETISRDIASVKKYGSAITVAPAIETIAVKNEDGEVGQIIDRSKCQLAKAPQCFYLGDLKQTHQRALDEGLTDFIDTAFLMQHYGHTLRTVEGKSDNIKITTPIDYYLFGAYIEARENGNDL